MFPALHGRRRAAVSALPQGNTLRRCVRIVLGVQSPWASDTPRNHPETSPAPRQRRRWLVALSLLAAAVSVILCLAVFLWPFRSSKLQASLAQALNAQIQIAHYRCVFLPHPGAIATGIIIRRRAPSGALWVGTAQTLYFQGRWRDLLLLQHRVHLVEITGLHVIVPFRQGALAGNSATQSRSTGSSPSSVIDRLQIHNAVLEILQDGGKSLIFDVHALQLMHLQTGREARFALDMENPFPSGRIVATGVLGPLHPRNLSETHIAGHFVFDQVRLSELGHLRGTLASNGSFNGPIRGLDAEATANILGFAVGDGDPEEASGSIHCVVDGINGDVFIKHVEVRSGQTPIQAVGQVAGSPKITKLRIDVEHGRAEDVLRPFIHGSAPIRGPVALHARAWLGPTGKPFLSRLRVEGYFDIPAELLTKPRAERSISAFSRRMEHNKTAKPDPSNSASLPSDVFSSLRGPAVIRNGVVFTPGISFQIPGAHARLHGTFDFHREVAHLTGTLKMDAGISHSTTGWKSILLKPLSPFFRRRHKPGSEIPIAILGNPGHYRISQNLLPHE